MGKDTKIEWADHTFNPWWGCTKVSAGCENCYAKSGASRWGFDVFGHYKGRRFFGDKHWNQPRVWNRKAEKLGIRYRVFCGSMCDVFERHVVDNQRTIMNLARKRLWSMIYDTPNLDWMLLTKRPENMRLMLPSTGVPENVWLGVTAENQEQADIRIPKLLKFKAKVLFVSIEPMLGQTDLWEFATCEETFGSMYDYRPTYEYYREWLKFQGIESDGKPIKFHSGIDWVICGGESGTDARPTHISMARSLRDQCNNAGVAYFFKQWGEWAPEENCNNEWAEGYRAFEWNDGSYSYRVGRKLAGSLLDGVEHKEFPNGNN